MKSQEQYIDILHDACFRANLERCKIAINNIEDINKADSEGETPLHLAAGEGHYEICKLLINNGAIVDVIDQLKQTPLHFAAGCGHVDVCQFLFDNGADIDHENIDGLTPNDTANINLHDNVIGFFENLELQKLKNNIPKKNTRHKL